MHFKRTNKHAVVKTLLEQIVFLRVGSYLSNGYCRLCALTLYDSGHQLQYKVMTAVHLWTIRLYHLALADSDVCDLSR